MRVFISGAYYSYWGNWHPSILDDPNGNAQVAGGETAMVKTAEGFARNGADTFVFYYGPTTKYRDVNYLNMNLWDEMASSVDHDLALTWEVPRVFSVATRAKKRWVAFQCNSSDVGIFDRIIDRYIFVSQWHAASMLSRDPRMDSTKFKLCPNGIDPVRYQQEHGPVKPHQVIHSSSPDRGLHHLLRVWPEVRKKVPDAELICSYKMSPWLKVVEEKLAVGWTLNTSDRAMEVYQRLKELEGHGVTYVDGVGQWQLARMQLESGAMVYPCDPVAPTEGFSISILEAHAAGIPVVTTDADALPELWGESTLMLRRPFSDAELTDAIVSVLTDENLRAALQTRGLAKAQEYNWTDIGDAFYQALKGELGGGE